MSEVELHYLQERMRGGLLKKARLGELKRWLPIGYEYDLDGKRLCHLKDEFRLQDGVIREVEKRALTDGGGKLVYLDTFPPCHRDPPD